ncbi:hypothetical protein ACFXDE_05395 [Kitasatospora sp. NPDC059408]|uniref:hypothetical protein n=1 Tax=Kitasatospora sp. NPDC059408 TaxID=3346823 RepID=UPI0036B0E7FB
MSLPLKRTAAAVATAVLGVVLTATAGQAAQSAPAPSAPGVRAGGVDATTAKVERLWALDGDDQKVKSGQQVPVRLKVRAVDKDRKPVKGATIAFSTPGPGLKFPDGKDDAAVTTDQDGYATAPQLTAAGHAGPDLVTASAGTKAQVAFSITIT